MSADSGPPSGDEVEEDTEFIPVTRDYGEMFKEAKKRVLLALRPGVAGNCHLLFRPRTAPISHIFTF